MTISEKEKKYLVVLGVVAAVGAIYMLGYKPLDTKASELRSEVSAMEAQVMQYQTTLKSQEFYESEIRTITEEIARIDDRLPQALPQELVIQTMDTISNDLKMTLPTLGFTEVEEIPLSSSSALSEVQLEEGADGSVQSGTSQGEGSLTGLKTSVTTATTCSYDEFKELLECVRELPMEVALENISLSAAENDLAVSFNISLYGLQVPNRIENFLSLGEYKVGKRDIFGTLGAGSSSTATEEQRIYEDFFIMIDPVYSDNTAITMGQVSDTNGSTYIHEETNELSEVVMNFTKENGRYYVQYQIGKIAYPADGSKLIFNPSQAIGLNIRSSKRVNDTDQNGIELTVNNRTDKTVYIYTRNDDIENPRVHLVGQTGAVKLK